MSIQWTFIAGYLYFEIAIVVIMIMPIFSPRRWYQFFKSRLFAMFQQNAAVYFYVLLGVLSLFLMDAVREMRKYSISKEATTSHLASEMKVNVKLFRAQRNFYITGFAIFLAFVIRRLVSMLIIQHELSLKAERIIQQAESTVQQAKTSILANTLQAGDSQHYAEVKNLLEETQSLLEEERNRVKELEGEVTKWRTKYEQALTPSGKGDE